MEVLKIFIANYPYPVFIVDSTTRQIHHANSAALSGSLKSVSANKFEDIIDIIELPVSQRNFTQYQDTWFLVSEKPFKWQEKEYQIIELKPRQGMPDKETLESWKNMIAVMLHRLRSPLTGISGYLELMEKENKNVNLEKRLISVNRGFTYIYELMDELEILYNIPANYDASKFSTVDLNSSLNEVLLSFSKEQHKRIKVVNTSGSITVQSFPESLKKVIKHLLTNALEHSDDPAIQVTISPDDNGSIAIKNIGVPISKEIRDQIFFPFVTTKATNLGIGLTMALLYAQQLGGTIFLEEDKETIQFIFKLPLLSA